MPHQAVIEQRNFSAGMRRTGAPQEADERQIYDLINGLYGEDASAFKRGGSKNLSTANFGTKAGTWVEDLHFDAGQRTVFANPDDFGVLDASEAPINLGSDGLANAVPSAFIEGMLFVGGGYIYGGSRKALSYSAGTVSVTNASKVVTGTTTAFLANVDPGMLFQRGNERVYVVASVDSDTQLTLRDAYEGTTAAGQAYTAHNIYKMTAADPYKETLSLLAVVANRLIGLKGTTVFVSDIGKPHKWTHTIGGTEVAAEVEITEGIKGTGLGVIGQLLLVFTTGGLWAIDGLAFDITDDLGNSNYREQVLSRDLVLLDPTGIATFRQALVVPCVDGVYVIDGVSSPERLSGPLDDLYREYTRQGYRAGQARVHQGHYFLPILASGLNDTVDLLVSRLDRPVRTDDGEIVYPWSRLAGAGGRITAFAVRQLETAKERLLLGVAPDSKRVLNCSQFFGPDANHALDHDGKAVEWMLVSRDFEGPNRTINMFRRLRSRYELRAEPNTPNPQIHFDWGTGFRSEGGPVWDSFDWAEDAASNELDLIWAETDDNVFTSLNCPGPTDNGSGAHRCRINQPARALRIRARSADPTATLRLLSLELFVRPSRAVRR